MNLTIRQRSFAFVSLILACCASALGQSSQGYLNDLGNTPYGVNIPVENGFINVSNGNLHLEFPIAAHPQRGALSLNERLVYDSRIWMFLPFGTHGSYHWWPKNVTPAGGTDASGGWRLIKGNEVGTISYQNISFQGYICNSDITNQQSYTQVDQILWTDPTGTAHPFSASLTSYYDACQNFFDQYLSPGAATDGSGYVVSNDGSNNPVITDNSGTQVYPTVIDRYGNYLSADGSGNLVDTTGRTPVIATQNGNVTTYDVLAPGGPINNRGTRVRYTVTTTSIYVATDFTPWNDSDIHQWVGTLNPVQRIELPNGSSYTFGYDADGELNSVTLPTGGTVAYGYANVFDSSNTQNRLLTRRTVGSNPATTITTSVVSLCSNYSDGCVERVNVHKPSGDETVYTMTLKSGAWNTAATVNAGSAANGGHPLLGVSSVNTYSNSCTSNCNGSTSIIGSVSTKTLYPTLNKSQTISTSDPVTGKPTSVQEWDYIASGQTFSGTPTRQTNYTYTGLDLSQVTLLDSAGVKAGQTTYGYTTSAIATSNVAGHGTANAGGPYLQTVSHWLNPGASPVTTYTMDDTGMVRSIVDPNQNPATTFTYQCNNALAGEVKNALNQSTQYVYDCDSGALMNVKDPNDLAASRAGTTYAYESGAGRPYTVTAPDGGQTTYTYPSFTEVDTSVLATPSPTITSSDIVDSFGRPSQHVQGGVSTETTYDANGRANCTTNPHFTSSSTDGSTCITSYDGLDRPLVQTQSDGVSTLNWSYSGNATTSSDEAGNPWTRTSDAFGRLTKVIEPGSYETDYTYNGLGNPTCIDQWGTGIPGPRCASSHARNLLYDTLGRLVQGYNPESGTICYGTTPGNAPPNGSNCTPRYDPNGNLTAKTDARGVTTTFTFDALNRLTAKHYSDATRAEFYAYDGNNETGIPLPQLGLQSDNAIGRLSLISDQINVAQVYSYDSMGRIKLQNQYLPSVNRWGTLIAAGYDLAGNRTSLTYPDGRHITQDWDNVGRLGDVKFADWNGQAVNHPYVSSASYMPSGAVSHMTLGNGVTIDNSFNNRLQPCEIKGSFPSSPGNSTALATFDKRLFYNTTGSLCGTAVGNNGNLASVGDALNVDKTQSFQYDALNRLSYAARSDGAFNFSYPMDLYGNMQQISNISGNPAISFPGNDNRMQLGGNGYTYDAAGNLVDTGQPMYGGHHFSFDGESRIAQVDSGGTATYTYDAAGQRVRKDAGGSWTEYVYFGGQVLTEKHADGTWSDSIYANGQRIARADSYDVRLHFSGTNCSNCGSQGWAYNIPVPRNTIQDGDRIAWRQFQYGPAVPRGGVGLLFSDGTYSNWVTLDQDHQVMNDDTIQNAWHYRVVDLSQYAGKTIDAAWIDEDAHSGAGNWEEFFADISYFRADGTAQPVFNRQTAVAYPSFGTSGVSNQALEVNVSNQPGDAVQFLNTTTYFMGDHLGTAQMEFAGAGWPVWKGDFAPYGQEIGPQQTVNNYKFTGLERDPETGLDHTQFRQLSSFQGRWMSPDPYDGSMDLGNPQTLNRYSYVGNDPLGFTDPSGLDRDGLGGIQLGFGCIGAAASGGGNVAADIGCGLNTLLHLLNLFHRPVFRGTLQPRPNGQIWDEHGSYKPKPYSSAAEILGLGQAGCEFGACGSGGFGFQSADCGCQPLRLPQVQGYPYWLLPTPFLSNVAQRLYDMTKGGNQKIVPTWAEGERPVAGESASTFADRVCKAQYPPSGAGCGTGPGSERNKIRKWARDKWGI